MSTVAPAAKVMGGLGEIDFIENPTVETVIDIICCVLDDVLYKLRVSVSWSPELNSYSSEGRGPRLRAQELCGTKPRGFGLRRVRPSDSKRSA